MAKKVEKKSKYLLHCGVCDAEGTEPVTCGYCKEQTGNKTIHNLCDKCFMKGCPVANLSK